MAAPSRQRHEQRPELRDVIPSDCVELHAMPLVVAHAEDGAAGDLPEWVQIVPAGEVDEESDERIVRGRDGRMFALPDPPSLVIEGIETPMQFDWDHLSVMPTFFGGSTRAAGWMDRVEWVEKPDKQRTAPGLWAHVERWTPDGRSDVEQGYYRGLSPVVRYQYREPAVEGDPPPPPLLRGVVNVALTNLPNLRMALLHSEGAPEPHNAPRPAREDRMDEHERALRARLGLPETATHAEVARAAIARFNELVPRADLEQALSRAHATEPTRRTLAARLGLDAHATVEQLLSGAHEQLVRSEREAHEADVTATIDGARRAGKIAPASVEHYRAMCATPEGLKGLKALFATLPSIVGADPKSDDDPPGLDSHKLTPEQLHIAKLRGMTADEYAAHLRGE